jgi:hypothetical protein
MTSSRAHRFSMRLHVTRLQNGMTCREFWDSLLVGELPVTATLQLTADRYAESRAQDM